MSARRREVYGRLAVQLRNHERPAVAENLCPGAMGLYAFLVIQARGEQTWGDVDELVAFASWGAATPKLLAYRRKQAEALIASGLVERQGGRLVVVKYAEHNDTPDVIAANREGARTRKQDQRNRDRGSQPPPGPDVTRDWDVTSRVTDASVTSSSFNSGSGSGSLGGAGGAPPGAPPDWWAKAVATVEQVVGPVDQPGARWLEYDASRERKGWARSHRDAVGWLTAVTREERTRARASPTRNAAETTKQPFDPDAPWMKVTA